MRRSAHLNEQTTLIVSDVTEMRLVQKQNAVSWDATRPIVGIISVLVFLNIKTQFKNSVFFIVLFSSTIMRPVFAPVDLNDVSDVKC